MRTMFLGLICGAAIAFPAGQANGQSGTATSEQATPQPATPSTASPAAAADVAQAPMVIRVATFNILDTRTEDLLHGDNPRLKAIAEVIQRLRPNVILINEIAYDSEDSPGFVKGSVPGSNGQRFADQYLAQKQVDGVEPMNFRAFMAPSNTGISSGFDLDNDGTITTTYPTPPGADAHGNPGKQTPAGRKYGNDCWGFGTFPGQYAMALLVDERLELQSEKARTFQRLPWDYLPGNFMPVNTDGTPWFSDEEKKLMRLSSKSHWDVPVALPNGAVVHFLCSHPTPPSFDGPEDRNGKRNHDELAFWMEYITDQPWIVDDENRLGGLAIDSHFVILGDLNADPTAGDSHKNPAGKLLSHAFVNNDLTPTSDVAIEGLDPTDTAHFKLRVDYVIPSKRLIPQRGGVWRLAPTSSPAPVPTPNAPQAAAGKKGEFPSDHFPVWMELEVPPPRAAITPPPIKIENASATPKPEATDVKEAQEPVDISK